MPFFFTRKPLNVKSNSTDGLFPHYSSDNSQMWALIPFETFFLFLFSANYCHKPSSPFPYFFRKRFFFVSWPFYFFLYQPSVPHSTLTVFSIYDLTHTLLFFRSFLTRPIVITLLLFFPLKHRLGTFARTHVHFF